jgi:tRNA(Arg) A34 adenosine deaminase TadA
MMISKRDHRHVETLRQFARPLVPVRAARIAAALVYKNRVVGVGYCQKKTHPLQSRYGKNPDAIYLHAEVDAIRNALNTVGPELISKCTMYVVRQKRAAGSLKWQDGIAKPCSGCQGAIAAFDIPRVVYTTNTGIDALWEKA